MRRPAVCDARLPNASVTSVSSVMKKRLPARHGPVHESRGVDSTTEDTEVTEVARG